MEPVPVQNRLSRFINGGDVSHERTSVINRNKQRHQTTTLRETHHQLSKRPETTQKTNEKHRPDIKGRKAIFEVHLKGLNLDGKSSEFSGRLAGLTPGFVGADIENLCNEAAIVAARRDKKKIEMEDFEVRRVC